MRWAISENTGRPVSYRVAQPDTILQPGEILVAENPDGKIWDSALGAMRGPNAFETLDEAKTQKKSEIRARVVSECEALMPVYEMLYCIRARVVDPRLTQLDTIAAKGRTLEARVNAAATEADVLAVVW